MSDVSTVSMRRRRVTAFQVLREMGSNRDAVNQRASAEFLELVVDDTEVGEVVMGATENPQFFGFLSLIFAVWASRTQQAKLRAAGDGAFLTTILELLGNFIQNGGLEIIAQFLASIVGIFGGLGARSDSELPIIEN